MSRSRLLLPLWLLLPAAALAHNGPDEPGAPGLRKPEPPPTYEDPPEVVDPGRTPAPPVAQPTPAPASRRVRRMIQPPANALLPVEIGAVGTRIGTSLSYSSSTDPFFGEVALLQWTVQGRIALDRFEVGLLLPALLRISDSRDNPETHMGNLRLDAKFRMVGNKAEPYAAALFVQVTLPTLSASEVERGRIGVQLREGITLTGLFDISTLGASASFWHWLRDRSDVALFDACLYAGLQPHSMVSIFAALQLGVPIDPTGDPALSAIFSVRAHPVAHYFADVGLRWALNDEGRFYTGESVLLGGGKLQLLVSLGYSFDSY